MNNKSLELIWQLACEIEGLTLLADKKEDGSLENLLSLIKSKSDILSTTTSDYINSLCVATNNVEDIAPSTPLPQPETTIDWIDEDDSDRAHGNLDDDFDMTDELSNNNDEDRVTGNLDDDYDFINETTIESTNIINKDSELTEINKDVELDMVEIDDTIDDDYVVCDDEDEDIELIDDEIEIVDNDVVEFDDNSADINSLADEIDEFESTIAEHQNKGWTVEQKIAVNESKDIKHAFTINDRFRFKRELFANSEIEMNDTLNLLSAMATIGEAEEYFFEDLEWDKDNDDVKDFMLIIQKHFASKQKS